LGYKVRGRWLKDIAAAVVTQYGGRVPDSLEDLMALPGVGRYTAGACLSFAFERPAGVLDTNVARIVGRLFAIPKEPGGAERLHRLWALAEAIVPTEDAWAFNQALMDFGSLVCTARKPACLLCPFRSWCPSGGEGSRAAEGTTGAGVVFWERPRPVRARRGAAC
jgi:A/G-specific adenine glycosylase